MSLLRSARKWSYNRRLNHIPRTKKSSDIGFASHGQDEYIARHLLPDVSEGVFFDIGANDGINISNTYYFEKVLNWTGIAIEPLPRAYKQLLVNRRCFKVNGCVTDYDGETRFLEIQDGCEMLSGIPNKFDKQHERRVRKYLRRYKASSHEIVVPCYTPARLLRKHGIAQVNYLSVDTEGGEIDILQAIDFQNIEIDVVSVENNYFGSTIEEFMVDSGYDLVAIGGVDEIYRKRNRRIAMLPRQMAA
jgi:FkbM family methyltransferase